MVGAEFYRALTAAGVGCYLDYRVAREGQRTSFLDCVIADAGQIVAIVEFKRFGRAGRNTRQLDRYRSIGPPVLLIRSAETYAAAVRWVEGYFGVTIAQAPEWIL